MLFLPLTVAITVSLLYGSMILCIISYVIAVRRNVSVFGTIIEHIGVALIIIVISSYLGKYLTLKFSG
jgi:hypothetical protein